MLRSFVDHHSRQIDEFHDDETPMVHLSPERPTPANFWDPIEYDQEEEPTKECVSAVLRHIAELKDHPHHGVFVEPEDYDVTKIHALLLGPIGTPYEGGFFHFVLRCPSDYPARPPLVRLMTTDSGRVRFHPCIYENGKVCLPLLGTDMVGPTWTQHHSIGNVVSTIRCMLSNENPIEKGSAFGVLPTMGTWLSSDICYNTVLRHETIRVAVCDAVEDCLHGRSACPNCLRKVILEYFPQFYCQYEKVVQERLPMTGSFMNDVLDSGVARYQYETLLARLHDLRGWVGLGS
ncbi:ubiquitin-conjugating enzyme E2 Z [Rhipicephalus microplus]|uniref:ubiquitin-conjugating enzyme E2 Z n=1 Tax=Rhipicephalus microplus TaxID=6941 RepID=UPI003F6CF9B3